MFKKSYLFTFGAFIYAIFLTAVPQFISFEYIVFVICNFLFFFQQILKYFKNLFLRTLNIEKLLLLIFLVSIISIVFNLSQDNLISFRQTLRDYAFLTYLFIPYLILKLNLRIKELKFLIFILALSGYVIFFKIIFKNLLNFSEFRFYFYDSYLHMDVLILFSLNFLTLYSFLNRMYLHSFVFLFHLFFLVYVMQFSGSSIFYINLIFIISIIFINFLLNKNKEFSKPIPIKYFVIFLVLLFIVIFFFKKDILLLLNNRNLEYIFVLDYYSASSFGNFFFGQSLGNSFILKYISPQPISFFHSFVLYVLLKFGMLGSALIFIYLTLISKINFINLRKTHHYLLLNKKNLILITSFTILFLGFFFTTFYKTYYFWIIFGFVVKYYHINPYNNEKIL